MTSYTDYAIESPKKLSMKSFHFLVAKKKTTVFGFKVFEFSRQKLPPLNKLFGGFSKNCNLLEWNNQN